MNAVFTGSGKTLAFGIPIIHTILEWKNSTQETTDDAEPMKQVESLYLPPVDEKEGLEAPEEDDEDAEDQNQGDSDENEADDVENEQLGCVRVIKNAEFDFDLKPSDAQSRPLLGLVLTPTRELAVQVKHHIDAVARFTGKSLLIKSVAMGVMWECRHI